MRRSLVLAMLLTAGCSAAVYHGDSLRSRASFDLRCPAAELQVTELDSKTAGVDGCGQRATYIYSSPADTWVLNSPGAEQHEAAFEGHPSSPPPGVLPGSPPGSQPGTMPGTLPGSPPGSPPGSRPGMPPHH